MSRRFAAAAIGCALALAALAPGAGAATLSDSFAGRQLVTGVPAEVAGNTSGAGREPGEPVPLTLSPAGHSLWFEWEAATPGFYTASTCGSAIPTVLAVYDGGDLATLSQLASGANLAQAACDPIRDGLTFFAPNAGKYQVLVDGNNFFVPPAAPPATEGPVSLRVEATPRPANDDLAQATTIGGRTTEEPNGTRRYVANSLGYNQGATKESGEPQHAGDPGGSSVWYSWTAPESGQVRISACCGSPNLIGVYTGNAIGGLAEVKSGRGSVEAPVVAGTTYRIGIDSELSATLGRPLTHDFSLLVMMELAPGPGYRDGPPAEGSAPSAGPDLMAPQTTIRKRVLKRKPPIVTFAFSSSEPGSSFRCSLDGARFKPCGARRSFSKPSPKRHTLRVFAVDPSDNADPSPAIARFKIQPPARHKAN